MRAALRGRPMCGDSETSGQLSLGPSWARASLPLTGAVGSLGRAGPGVHTRPLDSEAPARGHGPDAIRVIRAGPGPGPEKGAGVT